MGIKREKQGEHRVNKTAKAALSQGTTVPPVRKAAAATVHTAMGPLGISQRGLQSLKGRTGYWQLPGLSPHQ